MTGWDGEMGRGKKFVCVLAPVCNHLHVVWMIKCELPVVNPSGFRHSLSPPLPHSIAFSLSLTILPQQCLVHLRNRGCLATVPPQLSWTMDSLLIVGVCMYVCINVWECMSAVVSFIDPQWIGNRFCFVISWANKWFASIFLYHTSILLWHVCPCLLCLLSLVSGSEPLAVTHENSTPCIGPLLATQTEIQPIGSFNRQREKGWGRGREGGRA